MRICFFGESYVNGTGDPSYQGWVGRLCAQARTSGKDITAYNCGIRGATSTLIRATWYAEAKVRLTGMTPEAVVFSYGTNDSWHEADQPQVSLEDQTKNTTAILTESSAHWPTLMIGPPGFANYDATGARREDHAERDRAMKAVCAELGVPYFATLAAFDSFKHWCAEAMAGDGVHPGAQGYAEMAEELAAWPAWQELIAGA
jgi:acyl-CoA thioesterase-1